MLMLRVHDPVVLTCLFILCYATQQNTKEQKERRTGDGDTDFLDGRVVFLLEVIIGRDVFDLFVVEALSNVLLLFHYGCASVGIRGL